MKARNLAESFSYACTGVAQALASERNLRIHAGIAVAVGALAAVLRLGAAEAAALTLAASGVIVAEMINTAIEHCVDMITPDYHPLAAKVKNIAAAAVLTASVGAVIVGIVVLGPHLLRLIGIGSR